MPLRNKIKKLLDSREKTRYWLWKATNLSQNTAYRLYNDPTYIPGGDVMEVVYMALDVQLGDFLEYVPKHIITQLEPHNDNQPT